MATTSTSRVHCGVLTVVSVLVFSVAMFGQSKSAAPIARDLNSTLADLMRVAPATTQDLTISQQQSGGMLHRVTFWRGEKTQNLQISEALRRNLQFAVPGLVHDTQASGGSISTAFKLYQDLTVVCESLDSLLPAGSRGKPEWSALNNDLSDLSRLKEELSSYIQRTSVAIENRTPQPVSTTSHAPKRIIVDDNVPEKPVARKHRVTNQ